MRFWFVIIMFILSFPAVSFAADMELEKYKFRETKELIDFVHDAAELFSEKGKDAFSEFEEDDGRYLFVISISGTDLFDPHSPYLVGKNILDIRDFEGNYIIRQMIEVATRDPKNTSGWVHYLWTEPGGLLPAWKSSYVLKVKSPDGMEYIIGSGIYNIRTEKQFLVDTVDAAAKLIREKGLVAFRELSDRSSMFAYKDIYLFVIDMAGHAIVDPALSGLKIYTSADGGRDLIDFRDATGKMTVREMINKMKKGEPGWIHYMWPKPGEVAPSKKIAYLKKVELNGKAYIIGADMFAINPIWKKF